MKITPRALPADIWVVALFAGAVIMYLAHSLKVTVVVWLVLLVGGIIAAVLMANAKPQFQHHAAAASRPPRQPARPSDPAPCPASAVQVAVQQTTCSKSSRPLRTTAPSRWRPSWPFSAPRSPRCKAAGTTSTCTG